MKLDLNCTVYYLDSFLSISEAEVLYNELVTYKKLTNKFTMTLANGELFQENFGKMMFIDEDLFVANKFPSSIWGSSIIWSNTMRTLKDKIKNTFGFTFETCVCIYYPDGNTGVDYHADLVAFGDTTNIASISLGAERTFLLKENKSKKVTEIVLKNGSLLMMGENCQNNYQHSLPLIASCKKPRINLTFRKYGY